MLQAVLLLAIVAAEPSTPLDPVRKIEVDGRTRSYSFHVPPQYDPEKPTPVVLVFHGAAMGWARTMPKLFCIALRAAVTPGPE
jgi:poly(3-hydroxybutyrate) depolymerase